MWGGSQASDYLLKLVQLKYPNFPTRVTISQATVSTHSYICVKCLINFQALLRDQCYYSLDYNEDIRNAADPSKLADMGRIIQFPFVAAENYVTPEDAVLRMQEKKREQGRRLQAQAQANRQEKVGGAPMLDLEACILNFLVYSCYKRKRIWLPFLLFESSRRLTRRRTTLYVLPSSIHEHT